LNLLVADFAARLVDGPGVRVVSPEALASDGAEVIPPRDLRSDIRSGFPYSVSHASMLAHACVEVLLLAPARKGLITDLDDTLWRGLVGEIGPEAVSWDLDSGSHTHALYQQLIAGLSLRGVLVAIASKNDPQVVQKTLGRADLLIPTESIYPVAVSWGPKSLAVDQILRAWNIAASDVVFVDDSPMELAEVAALHPDIATVLFPATEPNAVAATLRQLASLFWRDHVNAEDRVRLSSLRSAAEVEETRRKTQDEPSFLRDLAGRITIRAGRSWQEQRALELVNKTNQFNLNGRRLDEAQWRQLCTRPGAIAWVVSYEDRFGPLGVISVLAGFRAERTLTIDCWVMSCRAFSRAIEHHILRNLCEQVDHVVLDFVPTERNGVLRAFLERAAPVDNPDSRLFDCGALCDSELADVHAVHYDSAN
jgi:FkbH-like protein